MARTVDPLPGDVFAGVFIFEVDGHEIGRFLEVHGLEVEVEVYRHDEGGVNEYAHQLPGRVSWPNLVLKAGLTKGDALFKWLEKTTQQGATAAKLERSTGAVVLLDREGGRQRSWSFAGAFPVRWRGPTLIAAAADTLIEELEISHQGFKPEG